MFHFRSAAAVVTAVTVLALTSCSSGSGAQDGGTADRLTLTTFAAPTSYDTGKGGEYGNRSPFFQAVFDTLLQKNSKGELEPWLATDWTYNDAKTELTLTLRSGVKFTDGTPLNADAVVASLEHLRDGTQPHAAAHKGKTFTAVDDVTVLISQPKPDPSLLDLLSVETGLIQAPSSFDDADAETKPVGSGPYILDTASSVTGTTYNYTANPDYWNADAVKYENLTIKVITDATATLNALKAGEANGVKIISNDAVPEVEASGWTVKANELDVQGLLLFDRAGTMAPQLADVRVRQAINMAFDREALLESLQSGYGTVTEQVFPTKSEGFDEALDSTYRYDPDGAKKLLAEAGYPGGFTIRMMTSPAFQTTFDLMAQQLADIGVTVEYTDPGANYITDMLAPKYPAAWMSVEQNADWQLINVLIAPTATFNPFDFADPTVNEYMNTVQTGTSEDAAQATKDLNAYLVDQAWFAPFYRVQASFAVDENTNVEFWPTNAYPSIFGFSPKN